MNPDFQDKIDDYVLGRMPFDSKAGFEAEIIQDKLKREQYEFTRDVKAAVDSRQQKMCQMELMKGRYDSTRAKDRHKASDRILLWTSCAAVVLGVCLFTGYNIFSSYNDSLHDEPLRGEDDIFDPGVMMPLDTINVKDTATVDTTHVATDRHVENE